MTQATSFRQLRNSGAPVAELRRWSQEGRFRDALNALEHLCLDLREQRTKEYAVECAAFFNGLTTANPPIPEGMDPEFAILVKEIVRKS